MKKKKQASSDAANGGQPSREQAEDKLVGTLKSFDELLRERELTQKIEEAFDRLIADAESGSKESADRVLRLALDCTTWLDKRVAANDPVILELAKAVPVWPTLFYPHQKTVSLPSTLGINYEALDVVKLAQRASTPREVAWRLLRLVDLLYKATEAEAYEHKLETTLKELAVFDVFGKEVHASFESKMQSELDRWRKDAKRCQASLVKATENFTQFLGVEDELFDADTFYRDLAGLFPLPPKEMPNAVDQWWQVAKRLFLISTSDHPERCKVLEKVAKSKADAYIKEFPNKHEGAKSVQKAGIIGEVGKAFKKIFRSPYEEGSRSLPPTAGSKRVKE